MASLVTKRSLSRWVAQNQVKHAGTVMLPLAEMERFVAELLKVGGSTQQMARSQAKQLLSQAQLILSNLSLNQRTTEQMSRR